MKVRHREHETLGDGAPSGYGEEWRAEFVRQWASRLGDALPPTMPASEVEANLRESLELLLEAVHDTGHDSGRIDEVAAAVAARLRALSATRDKAVFALFRSIEVLARDLTPGHSGESVSQLLAAIAREGADDSEVPRQASVRNERPEAELERQPDREHWYREAFDNVPVGVAISEVSGKIVEVNPALERMLGRGKAEFAALTLTDLFHPDDAEPLGAAYEDLAADGNPVRFPEPRRFVRADGEYVWTHLTVSLMENADGNSPHFLTAVEDISELHLLQERFHFQALHDAMTGLPNRQFFVTRLETALGSLPPDTELTLYHIALDGFELVNDGLGYQVGDRLVKEVARRLECLIDGYEAMAARFGGTEFAVLLRQTPESPGVAEFASSINDALAEPIYLERAGIATSASIGVVRAPVQEAATDTMLRAADVALRRAKSAGKRQWALFDREQYPSERSEAKLAAMIPGALEMGDFELTYQPMFDLSERAPVGLRAHLRWQPEGYDPLGHARCLALAEHTGATLSLRDWMVQTIWEQVATWQRSGSRPYVALDLSSNQATDPDLVGAVRRVVAERDVEPERLWLSFPMDVLLGGDDDARENVEVLGSVGLRTAAHQFRAAPDELNLLRRLPMGAVRLSAELVHLVHEAPDAPEARAVTRMLPLVRACDTTVVVDGVATEEQAQCWASIGCDVGTGPLFGDPVSALDVPLIRS